MARIILGEAIAGRGVSDDLERLARIYYPRSRHGRGRIGRQQVEGAPRLVYWIPLTFQFDLPDEKVVLRTHSLTVQNVGKESAEDVEVIHSARPDFMKIFPPLDFTEDTTPVGEHVIRIKNLGPTEHFFTQMLSYKTPIPALLNDRSKAGQAKPVPVQFQRIYPKWVYVLAAFLLVVAIFVISNLFYRGATYLVKLTGIT